MDISIGTGKETSLKEITNSTFVKIHYYHYNNL